MKIKILPLTTGVATLINSGCYLNKMAEKPNIILIMADDLGLNDLGVTGSDYHETPNLDAFAKESMTFTNAYSSAPNSAPSRACLMSGLYTPRHGVYTVNPPDRGVASKRKYIAVANNDTLDPKFKTIAEELKDSGYKNCYIGKWHLGNADEKPIRLIADLILTSEELMRELLFLTFSPMPGMQAVRNATPDWKKEKTTNI